MARARNIKPGFFANEILAELSFEWRLLFIGLWTLADREGRLEDRPKKIKMGIFPGDEIDVEAGLSALAGHGFINRYAVDVTKCIQITNFIKHQDPHYKEAASVLPAPDGHEDSGRTPGGVSEELRQAVFDRDGRQCLTCGSTENLSLDHIAPRSKGGSHDETNLQTLCRRCNSAKNKRLPSANHKASIGQSSANNGAIIGQSSANGPPDQPPLIPDSGFLIPDSPSLLPSSVETAGEKREEPSGPSGYENPEKPKTLEPQTAEVDQDFAREAAWHFEEATRLCPPKKLGALSACRKAWDLVLDAGMITQAELRECCKAHFRSFPPEEHRFVMRFDLWLAQGGWEPYLPRVRETAAASQRLRETLARAPPDETEDPLVLRLGELRPDPMPCANPIPDPQGCVA